MPSWTMPAYTVTVIGFLMGFGFGVGCALAVIYGVYVAGYRAALRDLALPQPSARLLREQARFARRAAKS